MIHLRSLFIVVNQNTNVKLPLHSEMRVNSGEKFGENHGTECNNKPRVNFVLQGLENDSNY